MTINGFVRKHKWDAFSSASAFKATSSPFAGRLSVTLRGLRGSNPRPSGTTLIMNIERPILMPLPDSGGSNGSVPNPESTPEGSPIYGVVHETVTFFVERHAKASQMEEGPRTTLVEGEVNLVMPIGEKFEGDFKKVNPLQERDHYFKVNTKKPSPHSFEVKALRERLQETGIPANEIGRMISSIFLDTLMYLREGHSGPPKKKDRRLSLNTTGTQRFTSGSGLSRGLRNIGRSGL